MCGVLEPPLVIPRSTTDIHDKHLYTLHVRSPGTPIGIPRSTTDIHDKHLSQLKNIHLVILATVPVTEKDVLDNVLKPLDMNH